MLEDLSNELMDLSEYGKDPKEYIEKKLKSLYNIQIYSKIYFGSNKQGFDLIFDSGSSWVWVEDSTCDNCRNPNKFKAWSSESYSLESMWKSSLRYGKGYVEGYDSTDMICLTP
jgi:hypothetical protein